MFGKYEICLLLASILIISWFFNDKRLQYRDSIIINSFFLCTLIIIVTFREAGLNGDYAAYVQMFQFPQSYIGDVESSLFLLRSISVSFSSSPIGFFFLYALIGIAVKYYAIIKYAPNILYSFCVWIAYIYILHDMIQIRAAVTSGIFLLMIPAIYKRQFVRFCILFLLAFFFHHSAIIFVFLFFIKRDRINPYFWSSIYIFFLLANIFSIDIYGIVNQLLMRLPAGLYSRIGNIDFSILSNNRMTIYSRYILVPTIIAFGCLFNIKRLQLIYPYTILCVKITFIAIFIYSLSLPIVSVRLCELLLANLIYLCPLCMFWYSNEYKIILGKLTVSFFCLCMTWNLLFKQGVFG